MAQCATCGKNEAWPFTCSYCKLKFCANHRLAEKHDCFKARHAKYIRKDWLRKKGQNITSGMYMVQCDQCGYRTELGSLIEVAGQQREDHVKEKGCDPLKVFLEEV